MRSLLVEYWKSEKNEILMGFEGGFRDGSKVVGVSSIFFSDIALMRESVALVAPAAQRPEVRKVGGSLMVRGENFLVNFLSIGMVTQIF